MKTCINGATIMPFSLEEDIVAAGKVGFEGIEIWTDKLKKYLTTYSVEDLKLLLKENNIEVASICPFFLRAFGEIEISLKEIEWGAKISSELNCPVLIVCPDVPPENLPYTEAVKIAGKSVRRCAEIGKNYGVKLAIEPLGMHPFVPGPKQALDIIEASESEFIRLILDTFHYYKSAISMEEIEKIPVEKLFIVHINDCESLPREKLRDANRLYPGLCVIPLIEILKILFKKQIPTVSFS
ncbi:sugar phosphate isomerase/epimerase [bacterium]|nr:sugar phosphate isomerase/epimerase [bacterium]